MYKLSTDPILDEQILPDQKHFDDPSHEVKRQTEQHIQKYKDF